MYLNLRNNFYFYNKDIYSVRKNKLENKTLIFSYITNTALTNKCWLNDEIFVNHCELLHYSVVLFCIYIYIYCIRSNHVLF